MKNRVWMAVLFSSCLVAVALLSIRSSAQQASLRIVDQVTTVDATGRRIAQGRQPDKALFEIDGRLISLVVLRDGFGGSSALYYESADCSGQPLLFALDYEFVSPGAAVGPPGNTIYVRAADATAEMKTLGSQQLPHKCQPTGGFPSPAVRAVALIDLNTQFTPPFTARVTQ